MRNLIICMALFAACSGKPEGDKVVLCDGHTKVDLPTGPASKATGQQISDELMAQWRAQHPDADWEADVRRSHPAIPPPEDNKAVLGGEGTQSELQAYGRYTAKDVAVWQRETERAVLEGARVFHDGDALGSTIAVSCDMCHPNAANTHPETYPKYQVQMGRVVLLRDMISWCLQHPVRAPAMAADDPRMRAMEAYILAQRKGASLAYGKH